jgi:hypothetical protein
MSLGKGGSISFDRVTKEDGELGGEGLTVYVQVYAILDEVFLAGEIEETSKQVVLTRLEHLDKLE